VFVLIADVGCCFRGLNSIQRFGAVVIVVMCQWKQDNGQSAGEVIRQGINSPIRCFYRPPYVINNACYIC